MRRNGKAIVELQDGVDLPATGDKIGRAIHVRSECPAAAEGKVVGYETVEGVRYVLVAPAIVGVWVIGVLEEEVIVACLRQVGVGVSILCIEAGGVAHAFGPGVVGLELEAMAETLLEVGLKRVVVGIAAGCSEASLAYQSL